MTRVKTADAGVALEALVRENARTAAGANSLVAKTEEPALEPYLAERASLLRSEGGKGTRVKESSLVARTLADAAELWSKYNPASNPASARYLSKAEIKAIAKESPALGALTLRAYQRVSGGGASNANAKQAVESFFQSFNFTPNDETGLHPLVAGLPGATMLDGRAPAIRGQLPVAVRGSFDLYGALMDADIGNAFLQRAKIGDHEVFIVFASTDGDPSFLEVFDKTGAPLTSARLNGNQIVAFDEIFGRTGFHPSVVHAAGVQHEEGLSEPEEQAAHGQPASNWPGVARLSQGELHYDASKGYRLTDIDVPLEKSDPRYEVAVAAFEYLWEVGLKYRLVGSSDPFRLGPMKDGELVLGPFERTDGKTYEVAKWRDIDDGSFTLYFERNAEGRLRLHTSQFDN